MHIAYNFDEIVSQPKVPIALTIGSFDGVHIGHQVILSHLVHTAKKQSAQSVVITFSNHPSDVLRPKQPTPLICTIPHKMKLLEELGIDLAIVLTFTKDFSEQPPEEFLQKITQTLPLKTLILGHDAHIGKDRKGNQATVSGLAEKMHFYVEYLADCNVGGHRISSSRIRDCVQQGNFQAVESLLGRPYSIYAPVLKGSGRGAPLGFPTANISVEGLCHPPHGVYTVSLSHNGKKYDGVANIGFAPTLNQARALVLEVHLLDKTIDLYGNLVEVEFHTFLRPERHFESVDALRAQIAQDVNTAKKMRAGKLSPN